MKVSAKYALALLLLLPSVSRAVPFHGCTLWQQPYRQFGRSCAQFQLEYDKCEVPYCGFWTCVWLPGFLFTGWFPEHLIEVTNRAGQSAFTAQDAPGLARQMQSASSNWTAHGDTVAVRALQDQPESEAQFSFWFGRSLPMPYGPEAWGLHSVGIDPGTPAPTCYSAVTEMAAETWADDVSLSGDRTLAMKWAPLTAPVCTIGAPLIGAVQSIPVGVGGLPDSSGCAANLSAQWQFNLAVSGADAYDPAKQCMGALGGMLPRTGWSDGDPWTAAQRVAWRTASLAQDYFRAGLGVRLDDKWQLIWPRTAAPACFKPGSLIRPSTAEPGSYLGNAPLHDSPTTGEVPASEFVFAVWRFHSTCIRTENVGAVEAEMLSWDAQKSAVCMPVNQQYPEPTR